jgi:hypothetical protein
MRNAKGIERAHPAGAVPDVGRIVQSKNVAQFPAVGIERFDLSICLDSQAGAEGDSAGVGYGKNVVLRRIAGFAGIKKIRVFAFAEWVDSDRDKVFDVKSARPAVPLFSVEAKNASKCEFIAQPITVAGVVIVATRRVSTNMWLGWVLEAFHPRS